MCTIKITTSYNCLITNAVNHNGILTSIPKKTLNNTINIYRQAVSYLIPIVNDHWNNIVDLPSLKQVNYIEHLVHTTDKHTAVYDFDKLFYKFPSYLRRSAINDAIAKVKPYQTNYNKWLQNGKIGKPSKLNCYHFVAPVFFKSNMYDKLDDFIIKIKVYHNNDWVWLTIKLKNTDVKYLQRHCKYKTELSPILIKSKNNYYLKFVYDEQVKLNTTNELKSRIVAVDLGLNNDATMCLMDSTGTVYARQFVNIAYEKDQLTHLLNKIKRDQKRYGYQNKALWRQVNHINKQISCKTSLAIIGFAIANQADCIVFEHLQLNGKKRGKVKQKLHLWRAKHIQAIVALKAHQNGIRISRVCAFNTSKLAYDGSGNVTRGEYTINGKTHYNYSICKFSTGKQYNCDLNASYNIGARFFLRAYDKTAKEEHKVKVKVSERTLHTLKEYIKSCV